MTNIEKNIYKRKYFVSYSMREISQYLRIKKARFFDKKRRKKMRINRKDGEIRKRRRK